MELTALWIRCLFLVLATLHGVRSEVPKVLKGRFGWLQTPNYPKEYADDLNLTWAIEVRPGFRIKLQFTWFDVEDSYDEDRGGSCVYDYVTVSEGAKSLGRFCGNSKMRGYDAPSLRRWIYTRSNKVTINFVSDFSNGDTSPAGFKLHYVEIDIDECFVLKDKQTAMTEDWDKFLTCNHFCHNVPGSYYCTCRHGFSLHANGHTCVATFCERQNLTAESGVILSPEFPRNYAKLSHCSWTIIVEAGLSIHLAFDEEFAIERHFEEGCVYDKLKITSSSGTETYCGTVAPQNGSLMDTQSNEVKIEFDTDLAIEMAGFRITYNTSKIRCLQPIADPQNGSIVSDLSTGYHEYRDSVQFSCDRGFDLIGEENITCLSNGSWDHSPPMCRTKSCGVPEALLAVQYSHIVNYNETKTKYLDVIRVECDTWYDMVGGTATWICENKKKWIRNGTVISATDGNLPVCKPICGVKGKSKTGGLAGLISGGTPTTKHEFPWIVLLTFGRGIDIESGEVCAGSLISLHYVLTAAHCLRPDSGPDKLPNETNIWVGVHDRRNPKGSGAELAEVEKITIHPEYHNFSLWDADVALVRLMKAVAMTDAHRTICLPSKPEHFNMATPGKYGTVAAWGSYDRTHRSSMTLRHADFPIVDNETCWEAHKNHSKQSGEELMLALTKNMFCAGYLHRQGTCGGDSGSAFMVRNKTTHTYYEIGLVSFGMKHCGRAFLYSGYAKLNQDIVKWIVNVTNNLE